MTDLTDERLAEIRALAEAATPGDWMACNMVHAERGDQMTPEEIGEYVTNSVKLGDPDRFLFITTSGEIAPDICHIGNGPAGPANAAFIAAAKPANVLSLLDALTSTRERAERAEESVAQINTCMCGDPVESHGYHSGHSPVSVAEYYSDQAAEATSRATAAEARVVELEGEVSDLKSDVVAFCAVWAVPYAKDRGLPPGHLMPEHYDILERCGARMDDFTRAALTTEKTDAES